MPLWANTDNANGQPKYVYALTRNGPQGSGNAAEAANAAALFGNVTPLAFGANNVVGSVGVTDAEFANSSAPDKPYVTHVGWQMRIAGTGGVANATGTGGSGFANGETVTVSGGGTNATLTVIANTTGNLAGFTVTNPGSGWANVAGTTSAFNREKHLTSITVGGTPTGYSNTDTIVASNGTVNATATVSTNSTGGFVTANVTITNGGLFGNTQANSTVAFAVRAANGSASAGSGATFAAGLTTSTGGTPTLTLGGRAGRIQYETIVAMGSISGAGTTIP